MKFFKTRLNLTFLLFSFLIFPAQIVCAGHMTNVPAVELPRKIAKRLLLLKTKVEARAELVPGFIFLVEQIENGAMIAAQDELRLGLNQLEKYANNLMQQGEVAESELIVHYLQKIKKDLADAPITSIERALPSPCSSAGAQNQGTLIGFNDVCAQNQQLVENDIFNGKVAINNTTDSVDCGSGALTVKGGVGIQGNLNVCGTEHINNLTPSIDCQHGALVVGGGVGIGQDLNVCGGITVGSAQQSNDCGSGALTVAGGLGVEGNLNVCGQTHIFSTASDSTCSGGALVVDGSIGIGAGANICGMVTIFDTAQSTNCTNGALVVAGGQGIGGNLNICGQEHIFNTTDSSACNNGALVVDGGVGIGKDLYVCGGISAQGPIITYSYFSINGNPVVATSLANCNLSVGDNTNPVANGTSNTAVGEGAMQNNQTGTNGTALGCCAMNMLTSGDGNTALGAFSLYSADPASENTAVGWQALYTNQVNGNVAVGAYALQASDFGIKNTAVGTNSQEYLQTITIGPSIPILQTQHQYANTNTSFGYESMKYSTFSYENIGLGVNALGGPGLLTVNLCYNIIVPPIPINYNLCLKNLYSLIFPGEPYPGIEVPFFPFQYGNIAIGDNAIQKPLFCYNNNAIGTNTIHNHYFAYDNVTHGNNTMSGGYSYINYMNTVIGNDAMNNQYLNFSSYNTVCGRRGLAGMYYGTDNTVVGDSAVSSSNFNYRNTAVGVDTLGGNKTFSVSNLQPLYDNTAVGWHAMKSAYGDCNVAVGSNALANNIEGYFNVAVGYAAIYAAVDELLTAVGANCQAVGLACTLVGYNTFATGEGAITIGSEAVTDGLQSIAIGQAVDCNGIGSICIGGEAEVAALASICIGHAGTSDGEGTVAIGDAIEVTGAGSIGIGEGAAINGAGIIGIGNGITVDGAGAIGMGNGVAVVGAACIGIGDGTDAAGAGAIGIGNGVSVDGAGCIAIGNGVLMVGESGIAIGDGAIALLDQIEIGSVANEIGGCFIHGILEGGTDDPFVLNYVPIIGTVTYEVCAACAVLRPGQLRGLDLLNAELTRGQSEKLMQLEPVFYRSAYDSTQVKARLVAPEDPAEFCPELMTTVDGKPTSRLQLDKAFIALLNLVKEHNVLIKDQQMRIASMQIELDELRQKNNR